MTGDYYVGGYLLRARTDHNGVIYYELVMQGKKMVPVCFITKEFPSARENGHTCVLCGLALLLELSLSIYI